MLSLDVPFMEVLNSEATGKMNKEPGA